MIPSFWESMKDGGLFVIPLVVLTVALLMRFTPTMVGIMGTIAVFLIALLKANSRIGPIGLARVLSETCYRMVPVAGACAAAGLVMGGITMTGLVGKISHLVNGLTDGQWFLTLLVTAAVTAEGFICRHPQRNPAAKTDPDRHWRDVLTANMFVLYYAVMSALTPPVAVAAYAASSLAEDNPLYIAVLAVKFGLALCRPFRFCHGPELLMQGPPLQIDCLW